MLCQALAEAADEAERAVEREEQLRAAHAAAEAALQQEAGELREQIAAWAEAKAKRIADADELLKLRVLVRKLEGQLSAQARVIIPAPYPALRLLLLACKAQPRWRSLSCRLSCSFAATPLASANTWLA